MTAFRTFLSSAILIAFVFIATPSAHADLYDSQSAYNGWRSTNGNYNTVRINDAGRDVASHALFRLFNDYFADVQGVGGNQYASGNSLWQERGIKQDTIFTADSTRTVRLEAAYRVADYDHTLGLYQNKTVGNYSDGMNYGASDWSISFGQTYKTSIRGDTDSKFKTLGTVVNLEGHDGEMRWLMNADKNFIRDGVNTSSWGKFSSGDDIIHMLVFDVSDLMYEKLSLTRGDIERDTFTAYMVAWEDMAKTHNGIFPDFDYQDFVGIYTNFGIKDYVSPFVPPTDPPAPPTGPPTGGNAITPEPATLLIAGLGIAGLTFGRRRKK